MPPRRGRDDKSRRRAVDRLFEPIDIASIVYFRIAFGLTMVFQIVHEFQTGNAENIYVKPRLHFSYLGFGWIEPLPGDLMYALLICLGALGLCIAMGFAYRPAAVLFFLGFTYTFLIDKAAYQNHLYLMCLLSLLMIFIPAHRAGSIDAKLGWTKCASTLPAWTLWVLMFQIGIVYFFGGVAKINPDWFRGEPIGLWLASRADWPVIGPFVDEYWFVAIFTFGGLLLDLLIVPALLWRRTRPYAFAAAVAFHLTNNWIFSIGVFPWLMILATALYFPPDWPRRMAASVRTLLAVRDRTQGRRVRRAHPIIQVGKKKLTLTLLAAYVAIQIAMPLRHYFYPGEVSWTEEGHYFSWHMMLRYKQIAEQQIVVKDPGTTTTWRIRLSDYLEMWQARNMLDNPDMLLQFCHFLADERRRLGVANPQVFALVRVGLNGRPPQTLVNPRVDLAAQARSLEPKPWIMPLHDSDVSVVRQR